jgi:hypothetical protein
VPRCKKNKVDLLVEWDIVELKVTCSPGWHLGFAPEVQFFASFCDSRFYNSAVIAFLAGGVAHKAQNCAEQCAAARNRPLKQGLGKHAGRPQSRTGLAIFFTMIAICKKSDKCGTMMMLLPGDHNGDPWS